MLKYKVLVGNSWVEQQPVEGDLYRIEYEGQIVQQAMVFTATVEPDEPEEVDE